MIYGINDKLPIGKFILSCFQLLFSIFTATALIASICGMNAPAAFIGAGLGTLIYVGTTKFKSPMFISNSGNYVAPVLMALQTGGYAAVAVGGITSCIVYCIFGLIFSRIPVKAIYNVFPKALIGAVTCVIGLNLMTFIPTYIGDTRNIGIVVALVTMLITALASHYITNGVLSMFPFLIGLIGGYLFAIPFGLVDFSIFNNIGLFCKPEFAFTLWEQFDTAKVASIVLIYIAFTISAMMECLSDHAALGNIIGVDLYENPGLGRVFIGEGLANLVSSCVGGLGACSYGEGVATVGFSKCASVYVTVGSAILLMMLGIFAPIQAFIASVPSVVFAGLAITLYGFIALSGIKILKSVDLNIQKNLLIVSAVLSIGVSGIAFGNETFALSGTAFALVAGVLLNIILRDRKTAIKKQEQFDSEIDRQPVTIIETDDGTKVELVEY